MISGLIDILAPDYCYLCGKIGSVLCESCIYDITDEPFGRCIQCLTPTVGDNLCSSCRNPLDSAWVVGARTDVLEKLVNDSKFSANRRACRAQANLLDRVLPRLDESAVLVPIPTIWRHRRERGYGHAEYLAKNLARLRSLDCRPDYLRRISDSVQHGATRARRLAQAARAFAPGGQIDPERPVILVDDVYTTGASMRAAASLLRRSGVGIVSAAITTRQILDE